MIENPAPLYYVWGLDSIAYGPVELPALVSWIKDGRVLPDTWVFAGAASVWTKAGELPELKVLFRQRVAAPLPTAFATGQITAGSLRRIKILADLEERILESLMRYMKPMEIAQFATVVQPGEAADAMYFILQGELRAYVLLDGKESTLAILQPGEFFGEIALLDRGERTAFVTANQPSTVLKLPADNFDLILREAPALAAPFALGLARSVAARLRGLNKRYEDSIRFSRAAAHEPA